MAWWRSRKALVGSAAGKHLMGVRGINEYTSVSVVFNCSAVS